MTTKTLAGTYSAGYTLQSPLTALTVAGSGFVEGSGLATSSTATGSYAVVNFGRVVSPAASKASGVYLAAGGSVTNGGPAHVHTPIEGYSGIHVASGVGDIHNFGTIYGESGSPSHAGIDLNGGGTITNGSAADTTAIVSGNDIAINVSNAAGTVTNFGTVKAANSTKYSSFAVYLDEGTIINGSNADTTALIQAQNGVSVYGVGRVTNFGTIFGSGDLVGNAGLTLGGGEVTNGSLTDSSALIEGYGGLNAGYGSITNFGVIVATGKSEAVLIDYAGGALTNGGAGHAGALIEGSYGVVAYGYKGLPADVTNFGTIEGTGTVAVYFLNQYAILNVEAGSTFIGAITGSGGTLNLASGVGTLSGLSASSVTVSGSMAATTFQAFGTVEVAAGAAFTDADASSAIGAGDKLVDDGRLTLSGAIANAGQIDLNAATLTVGAAGLSLTGVGTVVMSSSAASVISGASSGSTLTNGATIKGAGQLGDGTMTLDNAAGALIEGTGGVALTINTGAHLITNAGTIQAQGSGGVTISSALLNKGVLIANPGTLDVLGAVSGIGHVNINGGTAEFTSTFNQNVAFTGTTGVLELSKTDSGEVTGLSKTGSDAIDLEAIDFADSPTWSYSGTSTSGVLTVKDTAGHSANITLEGDYLASTFTLSAGPGTGTKVVDPATAGPSPAAATHQFLAAMAGIGASAAASVTMGVDAWRAPPPTLVASRALA